MNSENQDLEKQSPYLIEEVKEEQEYFEFVLNTIKSEEIDYWIGNPVVEIITGTLYLRKDEQLKQIQDLEQYQLLSQKQLITSNVLICPAIPNNKSPVEFCEFIKGFEEQIIEMKVLKTSLTKFYSIIILLDNEKTADNFYKRYNCQKYNEIENQICIIKEVESVTINIEPYNLKKNDDDIIKLQKPNSVHSDVNEKQQPDSLFMIKKNQFSFQQSMCDSKDNLQKQQQQQQQQDKCIDCTICFEKLIQENNQLQKMIKSQSQESLENQSPRTSENQEMSRKKQLQSQDTLIGILCGHYFHKSCLISWKNSNSCPICRYHQYPPEVSYCEFCGANEALWICLICGSINCGFEFMQNSHVREHYNQQKHTYAMEIDSKFVYDHSKNQFVHRLLQNYLDGKIVQINSEVTQGGQNESKKFNEILKEYETLMGKELETQRNYFKQKLNDIQKKSKHKLDSLGLKEAELEKELELVQQKLAQEQINLKQQEQQFTFQKEQFLSLNTQMNNLEKENQQLAKESQEYEIQVKKINETQLEKLKHLKSEVLKSQLELKDLEAHIKAKDQLKNQLNSKDASESTMFILDQNDSNRKKKQSKK